MTPAMEEVARLRKKTIEEPVPVLNFQNSSRVTRSRVAKRKRKIIFHIYIYKFHFFLLDFLLEKKNYFYKFIRKIYYVKSLWDSDDHHLLLDLGMI